MLETQGEVIDPPQRPRALGEAAHIELLTCVVQGDIRETRKGRKK